MSTQNFRNIPRFHGRRALFAFAGLLAISISALRLRADEPYARSRDYDLQHSRIALRFNLEQKKVIGDVIHTLTVLREATSKIVFDSAGLTIQNVTVNKSPAKFETKDGKLSVALPAAARAGEKLNIEIRYEGKPTKGLYFILPDKDYPDRPKQIWTQGESEDTRYYLPTYDYPNDRLTTETILTVPASWITVSNGKLISVTDAGKGLKTWYWKESVPSSTYLITVVAGEFDELKDTWHGIPVTYYAPKGRGDRLAINYSRTPAMMDLFSKKLGVDYPWEKYAQVMVDDFVAGGMENSSATTNSGTSLVHPQLAPEYPAGQDALISHELGHQWFGDLVTCKDWGDIWLNEGFATFMETVWSEAHYGRDQADYERWERARAWFDSMNLWSKPVVRHDFDDSSEFDGNVYDKSGWILYMLRHQIGEDGFYRGLKHYLEANRGKNVVTADFAKAIEEATHVNIDQFLGQWIYGAGAPKFDLSYTYDDQKHQVALTVKQTQNIEGRVGIFRVPVEVEISTASGLKLYNIAVSKDKQTFSLPAQSAPLMVLFDKGGHVLKSAEFHKEKKEWLYQLKNASEVADRADAVIALGNFKDDAAIVAKLNSIAKEDRSYRARAAALQALGSLKAPNAFATLDAAVAADSPDGFLRNAALRAFGSFGDDKAVPLLLQWSAAGKPIEARTAAINSLGRLQKDNKEITKQIAAYVTEPHFRVRMAAIYALGGRGDATAIPALEALLKSDDLSIEMAPMIKGQIARLKKPADAKPGANAGSGDAGEEFAEDGGEKLSTEQRLEKLEHLLQEMSERLKSMEKRLPPPKP